ncbi:MAG: SDR family NAD(P)-dependent oxidoreductase [Lachnospiraceae bacterium]
MKELAQKKCIITGSARGIGKAVAMKYAKSGADVILMDINSELLAATAEEIAQAYGTKVYPVYVNAALAESVDQAMDEVEQLVGAADILANCAGISTSKKMIDVELDEWERVMSINLQSVFQLSNRFAKAFQRESKKKGHIISISSQASKVGEYGNGVYSISKAGVNMLTQILGLEYAELGITATAICPGYVNTEMMQEVFKKRGPIEGMTPEQYEKTLTSRIPLGRMCEPEEIAELMLFLASERANYITGVTLTIAGGTTLF